jgi:YrbI family 3-deoxy-D-manno-octulosonate 8-phosphate phosphatase
LKKITEDLIKKILKVKIVITDVDGVLTDGGLYYTEDGLTLKRFNVKDGMGVGKLRDNGIESGIISTDVSGIMKTRAERIKMDFVYTGIWDKEEKMFEVCEERGIKPENIAFIGDDINDTKVIKDSGFSACPSDAVPEIKAIVDYICENKGGNAVFRELADLIINVQNKK